MGFSELVALLTDNSVQRGRAALRRRFRQRVLATRLLLRLLQHRAAPIASKNCLSPIYFPVTELPTVVQSADTVDAEKIRYRTIQQEKQHAAVYPS